MILNWGSSTFPPFAFFNTGQWECFPRWLPISDNNREIQRLLSSSLLIQPRLSCLFAFPFFCRPSLTDYQLSHTVVINICTLICHHLFLSHFTIPYRLIWEASSQAQNFSPDKKTAAQHNCLGHNGLLHGPVSAKPPRSTCLLMENIGSSLNISEHFIIYWFNFSASSTDMHVINSSAHLIYTNVPLSLCRLSLFALKMSELTIGLLLVSGVLQWWRSIPYGKHNPQKGYCSKQTRSLKSYSTFVIFLGQP